MSPHFPVCNAHEVVRVLRRHADGHQVIVPMHGIKPIPIGTLKSIIKGSGLDAAEFR